jgi:hypothetical protein
MFIVWAACYIAYFVCVYGKRRAAQQKVDKEEEDRKHQELIDAIKRQR